MRITKKRVDAGIAIPARDNRFAQGALSAAVVASVHYDATSTHEHQLGDCILAKLNLSTRVPRRNRRRVESPDRAFVRGFAAGVAEMRRQLAVDVPDDEQARGSRHDASARTVVRDAGLTLDLLRASGVRPGDVRRLRRAGVR